MNQQQYQFFSHNGYLVVDGLFSAEELNDFSALYENDLSTYPEMWKPFSKQTVNCDALLTTPEFDRVIRHPALMVYLNALMGGPVSLGEICARHMAPYAGETIRGWHRDRPHWNEHPLRMDFIQLMLYLTDVSEETHCFSISPEPADAPILDNEGQLERNGIVDFHGPAGTVVLFNVSCLHTATVRPTSDERKTIQVYYGHPARPYLSNCTVVDESWLQHSDSEVRAFYGTLNRKTERYLERRENGELEDLGSKLEWCLHYDSELKAADNQARTNDEPSATGEEHGTEGE